MPASTMRFAALLCVFVLLQDCCHVHMAKHARSHKQVKGVKNNDHEYNGQSSHPNENNSMQLDPDNVDLVPQKPLHQRSSRRGWISSVFKVLKVGGKVLSTATSIAGLGNAIFRAIAGCCADFPDACTFRDEFIQLKAQIHEKSTRADEIELQAANIQVYTNYTINKYEDLLDELNEIANEQETFLSSISPEVSIALNNETAVVKKLIKEKKEKGEEVNFTEISSLYESALDSALTIGFPLVGLVVPAAKKIYSFAKQRAAASSTAKVEVETSSKLVDGPKKKSRLGRFLSAGKQQYRAKVDSIKLKLNQRFGRAVKIGKSIGSGLKVAMSYFNAGLNIYMIIASRDSCKARQDEARSARDELQKSIVFFEETERNITKAKNVMEQAFQYLRGNITHESTLSVIENIKTMVEGMSGPSDDLVEVAVDLQHFLDNIKEDTSLQGTYQLEEQLYNALRKIPFTISCYTNKVKMVNFIISSCRQGKGSFDAIYGDARGYFDHDDEENADSPQNCARKTGYRYVDKEDLLNAWKDVARKEKVNENCVLNDPAKKETACSFMKDGYEAAEIAEKMKISMAEAQSLIDSCPVATELTPSEKEQVCNLKVLHLNNDLIATALSLKEKLVTKVEC